MKLTIDIPATIDVELRRQYGPDFDQAAKEALAIVWYRDEKLSIGQVAELLGLSVYEAEGLLKKHRVAATYSVEDFDRDRQTLDRLLQP
jgi:predicted HTH domain antitoxin